jgi:hypothetical protein
LQNPGPTNGDNLSTAEPAELSGIKKKDLREKYNEIDTNKRKYRTLI